MKNAVCLIPHAYDVGCVLIGCHHITSPDGWHEAATVDLTEPLTCDGQTDKCSWQQWTLSVGSTVDEIRETPETESRVISPSNTCVTAYSSIGQVVHCTVRPFHEFAKRDSPGLTNKMSVPSFVLLLLLLRVLCPSQFYGIYGFKSTDIFLEVEVMWRNLNRMFAYFTLDVLMKYIHCSHVFTAHWLLYLPPVYHSAILRSAHTVYLCILCVSQNKQRLLPYTALTDWFL